MNTNDIPITQGNTEVIAIVPRDSEGQPIQMQEGDKVVFKVEACRKEVIKHVLTAADWDAEAQALVLVLEPEETVSLPPMAYTYDCLYVFADGTAKTFIEQSKFTVQPACAKVGDAT